MIFWACILLTAVCFAIGFFVDDMEEVFLVIGSIGFVATIIMLIFVIAGNVGQDAKLDREYERYESLVYQYENDIYENDNDLGKRELMVDIQEWNSNLAYKQRIQDNFWIGIFYPNIYHHLEFIELK